MNDKLLTPLFWKDAIDRALWTAAQFFLSLQGIFIPLVSYVSSGDFEAGLNFALLTLPGAIVATLGAALFSIVKSVAAAYNSGTDTTSFVVDIQPLNKKG